MKTIKILGIPFSCINADEAVDILESWMEVGRGHCVVTPNPEGVMQAKRNPDFRNALLCADLALADGIGITMAAKFLGTPLPGRVRGYDTIMDLLTRMNTKRPFTAYFLGGQPSVAESAKKKMEARFPQLRVVGYHHGFFKPEHEAGILDEINRLSPEILLVCTGMPRSEIWAEKNKNLNTKIILSLGGTLDIMADSVRLAPAPLRRLGLEWVYRLLTQPSRAKRQLDIPRFVLAVLREMRNED